MSGKYERWVETRQRVEARTASGDQVHATGKVIAYTDAPTVSIQTDDGQHISWRADLTKPVDPLCGATEGATGITCQLPRYHANTVDHEGAHDPATAGHDGIGYRLTVRWPWCTWDRDAAVVDNEAIETGQYYVEKARKAAAVESGPVGGEVERALQQRNAPAQGPEFWIGDGSEEPPHSVRKVADAAGDYLTRSGDDWVGDGGNGYAAKVKPWVDHILPKYAPYTEVSS